MSSDSFNQYDPSSSAWFWRTRYEQEMEGLQKQQNELLQRQVNQVEQAQNDVRLPTKVALGTDIYADSGGVTYVELLNVIDKKIRITIHANSEMARRRAVVEHLTTAASWQRLHSIPPTKMKTPAIIGDLNVPEASVHPAFQEDRLTLMGMALDLLFP